MAIRTYKPVTPSRRGMTTADTVNLTKSKPPKSLLRAIKDKAGRNNQGRLTVRHRGGGTKHFYRLVDFKLLDGTKAKVVALHYDPSRSARIALVELSDNKLAYILAGAKMKVGSTIQIGEDAKISVHNRLPLKKIPTGSVIYNIELSPGRGGQLVRSAGGRAQLVAKEGDWAQVRLPSGEVHKIHVNCYATLGSIGNEQHQNIKWGSAGRMRRKGIRPTVRGKAMNPADHPMGGGEGLSGPGRIPRTPWGQVAIGKKTRRRKSTAGMIIRSRHESKRG